MIDKQWLEAARETPPSWADNPVLRQKLDELKAKLPKVNGQDSADEKAILARLEPPTEPGYLGRLKQYQVLKVLGHGGFGVVLLAYDPGLARLAAIKVLSPQLAASTADRQRFMQEARAIGNLRDSHIVSVWEVDSFPDGLPFFVMEYVEGFSLQEKLDSTGPLPLKDVLRIGQQVALGLAAAHAKGLVHRDVKPANILLEKGEEERVKLTDFGLVQIADAAQHLTQKGQLAGTPEYMAPEQFRGGPIDHRADLFALGTVLFVLATGRSPFRASSYHATVRRVCDESPRVREINPTLPEWLDAIIAKLHAKMPEERFQTASEIATTIERYQNDPKHTEGALIPWPQSVVTSETRKSNMQPKDFEQSMFGKMSLILWYILAVIIFLGGGLILGIEAFKHYNARWLAELAATRDQNAMAGPWAIVSSTSEGEDQGSALAVWEPDGKLELVGGNGLVLLSARLYPSTQPKNIDLTYLTHPVKEREGKVVLGIYEISEKELRLCFARSGQDRPKEFASRAGSDHVLLVMKRFSSLSSIAADKSALARLLDARSEELAPIREDFRIHRVSFDAETRFLTLSLAKPRKEVAAPPGNPDSGPRKQGIGVPPIPIAPAFPPQYRPTEKMVPFTFLFQFQTEEFAVLLTFYCTPTFRVSEGAEDFFHGQVLIPKVVAQHGAKVTIQKRDYPEILQLLSRAHEANAFNPNLHFAGIPAPWKVIESRRFNSKKQIRWTLRAPAADHKAAVAQEFAAAKGKVCIFSRDSGGRLEDKITEVPWIVGPTVLENDGSRTKTLTIDVPDAALQARFFELIDRKVP